jgi:hypothetical protein
MFFKWLRKKREITSLGDCKLYYLVFTHVSTFNDIIISLGDCKLFYLVFTCVSEVNDKCCCVLGT